VKVIHKPRQTGKTTELIKIASQEGGYIVCHSRDEAYRISKTAEESGKPILFPITYDEYLNGLFCGKNIKAFYIDNVELLLSRIARGVPVNAISVNGEYVLFNDLQETKVPPSFREDRLIEAFERYISQYGPGYSSTDTRAFDDAKAILAAVKQGGN